MCFYSWFQKSCKKESTKTENTTPVAECAVCLEMIFSDDIEGLVCGHIFHKKCIKLWQSRSNLCPICGFDTDLVVDIGLL